MEKTLRFPKVFESSEYKQLQAESLEFHQANPELTSAAYLFWLHAVLSFSLSKKKVIYLDTLHWINLRHVVLGNKNENIIYREILSLLHRLVDKKEILCPVSLPLFQELMKQNNEGTRYETARLMDRLSEGVCLKSPDEIEKLELKHQIAKIIFDERGKDYSSRIFTKIGFLAGQFLPSHEAINAEKLKLVQKSFIDFMWSISLEHFIDVVSPDDLEDDTDQELVDLSNNDATKNRSQNYSFEEICINEKATRARILLKSLEETVKEILGEHPGCQPSKAPPGIKPDPYVLPSLQVIAGIESALIATQGERYSMNDIIDFSHVAIAIPYCDALFCDNAMAHKLSTKPLNFGKIYNTEILSRPNDILSYLKKLSK